MLTDSEPNRPGFLPIFSCSRRAIWMHNGVSTFRMAVKCSEASKDCSDCTRPHREEHENKFQK